MKHDSKNNMVGSALEQWHSCLKMGRAFRACPMVLAGIESSGRRERPLREDDTDTPDEDPKERTQESISQLGLQTALERLLDGFRSIGDIPLGEGVPGRSGKEIVAGVPAAALPFVGPVLDGVPSIPKMAQLPNFLTSGFTEEVWRSLFLDKVELTSANAGVLRRSPLDIFRRGSENEAWTIALRIAESFVGRLLNSALSPSGQSSSVSSTAIGTSPKEGVNVKQVAGASAAGAALVGAGILAKTRRGGGGRGVSSPSPRGGGGKFFEAGKKFPILQPAR